MANLQLQIPLASLDAVVISHSHPDHWSDLEGLYVAMRYFLGRQGFPVYAPEGLRDLMTRGEPDGTLDWRVIGDGDSAQLGAGHAGPGRGPTTRSKRLAARVEVGRRALGYSADTGAAWEFEQAGTEGSRWRWWKRA